MFKLIVVTAVLSLTQAAIADVDKGMSKQPIMDMMAANQAHVSIQAGEKKNQPLWSKDQVRQAELEKKYKDEITANPDNKKTYAYLAGLYLTNNKTLKAIDAYQDAITHDAENPKLFAAISIAYLHQSKFAMAKAMADEALRLDPELKQVEKISEYIVAKQEAIKAASKVPVNDASANVTSSKMEVGHGAVIPKVLGARPKDAIHNPLK